MSVYRSVTYYFRKTYEKQIHQLNCYGADVYILLQTCFFVKSQIESSNMLDLKRKWYNNSPIQWKVKSDVPVPHKPWIASAHTKLDSLQTTSNKQMCKARFLKENMKTNASYMITFVYIYMYTYAETKYLYIKKYANEAHQICMFLQLDIHPTKWHKSCHLERSQDHQLPPEQMCQQKIKHAVEQTSQKSVYIYIYIKIRGLKENKSRWWIQIFFHFHPEWSILRSIFVKWVGSTTN